MSMSGKETKFMLSHDCLSVLAWFPAASPVSLLIIPILDDPAPHDLRPVPMFSANVGGSVVFI